MRAVVNLSCLLELYQMGTAWGGRRAGKNFISLVNKHPNSEQIQENLLKLTYREKIHKEVMVGCTLRVEGFMTRSAHGVAHDARG